MARRILTHGSFFYGDKTTMTTTHTTSTPHHSAKRQPAHSEEAAQGESAFVGSMTPSKFAGGNGMLPYRTPGRQRLETPASTARSCLYTCCLSVPVFVIVVGVKARSPASDSLVLVQVGQARPVLIHKYNYRAREGCTLAPGQSWW